MATKTNKKKRTTNSQKAGKNIDMAGLVKKSLFLIMAMAWAFILGVLVGKGYKPENAVPEIARIMPEPPKVPVAQPKTLTAEELGFYDRLKNAKSSQPKPTTAPQKPVPVIKKQQAVKRVPPATTPQSPTTTAPEKIFTYVYQVAAFRFETEAMRFQQKIIGQGIAAFVGKPSGGWYRVTVSFKGTPIEIRTLKNKLKTLGISRPILRAKKPI
ncbi:MAG: SPOR domain-containing protein [Desulfoplanes sp.]